MKGKLNKFLNKWIKITLGSSILVGYVKEAKLKKIETSLGMYNKLIFEGTMYLLERGYFTISDIQSTYADIADIKIISKEQAARFVNEQLRKYSLEVTGNVNLFPKLKQHITINRTTKLYCLVHGEVDLVEVTADEHYPIIVRDSKGKLHSYTKYGYLKEDCGECILFPSKEYRDWYTFK